MGLFRILRDWRKPWLEQSRHQDNPLAKIVLQVADALVNRGAHEARFNAPVGESFTVELDAEQLLVLPVRIHAGITAFLLNATRSGFIRRDRRFQVKADIQGVVTVRSDTNLEQSGVG